MVVMFLSRYLSLLNGKSFNYVLKASKVVLSKTFDIFNNLTHLAFSIGNLIYVES